MDAKQSKNFLAQLLEDLPAAGIPTTEAGSFSSPGKSVAKPFLRNESSATVRMEVWNYTNVPYIKGDIVVVSVDNYGICRVIDALSDSGMYVSSSSNITQSGGRPNLTAMLYAKGDAVASHSLAEIAVSPSNNISPKTRRNVYANPFNFRLGQPALFANARGFGYCYMDGAGDADQNKATRLAEGMIPVAQDSRLHFKIPANDAKTYNYGDLVFVSKAAGETVFTVASSAIGSIVAVCDAEKNQTVNYDFWMPFRPAGMLTSIDEAASAGVGGTGERYGFQKDANDPQLDVDETRGDFVTLRNGQQFFSPLFVDRFRVCAGTSYPVAVEWYGGTAANPNVHDIALSASDWISYYGKGTFKPEICIGDFITCIVDASGSVPVFTPVSFPMDYGFGVRMFFSAPPSGRLWQADQPQNNDIISITGSWNGKVAIDPNGTDLDIVAGGGIYEKITDNTVLVQG